MNGDEHAVDIDVLVDVLLNPRAYIRDVCMVKYQTFAWDGGYGGVAGMRIRGRRGGDFASSEKYEFHGCGELRSAAMITKNGCV